MAKTPEQMREEFERKEGFETVAQARQQQQEPKEVFPVKLDKNDLENAPFPSELDRAYVVEFLEKQFGDSWELMPEGEKKDAVELNMERGYAEAKRLMGPKWDKLTNAQRRDLFHTLFVEKAERLEEGFVAEPEPGPEAPAPSPEGPKEPESREQEAPLPVPEAEPEPSGSPVPEEAEEEKKTEFPGFTQWVAEHTADPEFTTDWSERLKQYRVAEKEFKERS